jgi:hypothetical protein
VGSASPGTRTAPPVAIPRPSARQDAINRCVICRPASRGEHPLDLPLQLRVLAAQPVQSASRRLSAIMKFPGLEGLAIT